MRCNLTKWISRLVLLTTAAVLATGCLSFRGGDLTKLDAKTKAPAPTVEKVRLDIRLSRNGKPFPEVSTKIAMGFHTAIAQQALTNSGLFKEVQMMVPGTASWPGEFVLKYEIDNWGSQAAAAVSGFICGFTLFTFPGFATDHYTVQAEVLDHQGKSCWKKKYDDKMTTVIWLGFFPCLFVPPCYPTSVLNSTLNNIYQHSFQDMLADKAFSLPNSSVSGTPPPVNQ
jgi:hypothetical protein